MALSRISLRDFVIVSELALDLDSGFTVLTGETGAGKSILIDALQLVTGARADSAMIREGADRTEVSAEFAANAHVLQWLDAAGYAASPEDNTLLLRRTVDRLGKSRGWINGSPATVAQLRELGEQLLDIHGQHAWQSLTRPDAMRGLLDAYGQIDTEPLALLWQAWRQAQTMLAQSSAAQATLQRERERLVWQITEVEKLDPQIGQWEALSTDHSRLSHAQTLLDAAQAALDLLDADESSVNHQLNTARARLEDQAHLEPQFKELSDILNSSLAQVDDAVRSLRAYLRRTDLEPERLRELDARMTLWVSLARRYHCPPDELAQNLTGWRAELDKLDAAGDLEALQEKVAQTQQAYMAFANGVSKLRSKAAPKLAKAITLAMQGLGMQGGAFEVALQKATQAMQSGLEEVSFLVAGHPGSSLRPVHKVASGGELSRIALAIAVTTSQLGTAQILVFDEVDAGVGGAIGETVGRLMKQLGQDRQVMAVTHLPQVAACADHHLVVAKHLSGSQTLSQVMTVTGEQRVGEIARMLAGERLSGTSLAHAKEMLQSGH
jgi:DNA repair protein RecN (Recombination protein N)